MLSSFNAFMRVAMSLLSGVSYGGVTYFHNLIPAFAAQDTINEYHVFVPKDHPLIPIIQQKNVIFHECVESNQSALKRFLWEQCILPRHLTRCKIDILFTAKNLNIFLARCKTVIAIRNMEPMRYHEYKNDWRLNIVSWIKLQLTKWSMRKSNAIVVVSHGVQDYVMQRFPGTKDKVKVIYNGNPIPILPSNSSKTLESPHFLLCASKFVTYANQLNLLKAYAILVQQDPNTPPLWFAGGMHDHSYFVQVRKYVEDNGLESRVQFLGLVSHDRLLELMRAAQIFIFPSTLESCPHTLIEAMACGAPIATSTIPPMPEICADAAVYFDPYDPDDIAKKIKDLRNNVVAQDHLAESGRVRVQFFTWQKTADELLNVFNDIHMYGHIYRH